MRLRIAHEIVATFDQPCTGAVRKLRMTPRTYDGQYVGAWRIDVDRDCRLDRVFDAYGNVVHNFSVAGPISSLSIVATGEVEVDDTAGILPATARERLPSGLFRRSTPVTEPDPAIRDLADRCRAAGGETVLECCHLLMSMLHAEMTHRDAAANAAIEPTCRPAAEVLASGEGDAADVAHLFVAASLALGAPARFVSGYLRRGDKRDAGQAAHAWAETFVDGLGWVGFDAPNDTCPTDAYVRVATSLDKSGACFVRGADQGPVDAEVVCRAMITQADL
ncbi:MAG TPA: transglutaminase family protein [Methylomirabilota bacterium]|nr:transglutaminase family protein [Methylomirabilota bacterium]